MLLRCTVKDAVARPGRPRLHGRGRRARAVVLPRLHDDRAARARPRRTASIAPPYVDRAAVDPDGRARRRHGARWSRTRRSSTRPSRGARRRPSPFPAQHRRAHPTAAAGHLRARALRRQGRRRQPRPVGRARRCRPGDVRRPRAVAVQDDVAAAGARAGARGGRPRRRRAGCCPTSVRSTWSSTGCSVTGSPRRRASTRRPRGSASGCGRARCRSSEELL